MEYNVTCKLWSNVIENFYRKHVFTALKQKGPNCVSTVLEIITGANPGVFQGLVNTQDPISWSIAISQFNMKLAYCPVDVRKLRFYIHELIELDDLFLLSYYLPIGMEILNDPDSNGWLAGSHIVVMHRNIIIDTKKGNSTPAIKHECNMHHTKRIFRVVPVTHPRGL